ncbi:hypothetical protein BH11PLA2_BH11PLA2_30620 [soil metagenome]
MSIQLKSWGEAKSPIPDGVYTATFNGLETAEAREFQGKQLGEGCYWSFGVTAGPLQGRKIGRITGLSPNPSTACGKMIIGLHGSQPKPGEDMTAMLQTWQGKSYRCQVIAGKVDSVMSVA